MRRAPGMSPRARASYRVLRFRRSISASSSTVRNSAECGRRLDAGRVGDSTSDGGDEPRPPSPLAGDAGAAREEVLIRRALFSIDSTPALVSSATERRWRLRTRDATGLQSDLIAMSSCYALTHATQ